MPFPGATGKGLKIAIIDSGINASHPHIVARTSGVFLGAERNSSDAWEDGLGHGTAVAAAIQEKAPGLSTSRSSCLIRHLQQRQTVWCKLSSGPSIAEWT